MNIDSITLGQVAVAIGIISGISGFFIGIYRWYQKAIVNRFTAIESDVKDIKKTQLEQDKDIKDSKEEMLLIIKAQLACLEGLKQGGANGPVTKAIDEINQYLIKKTHD